MSGLWIFCIHGRDDILAYSGVPGLQACHIIAYSHSISIVYRTWLSVEAAGLITLKDEIRTALFVISGYYTRHVRSSFLAYQNIHEDNVQENQYSDYRGRGGFDC